MVRLCLAWLDMLIKEMSGKGNNRGKDWVAMSLYGVIPNNHTKLDHGK